VGAARGRLTWHGPGASGTRTCLHPSLRFAAGTGFRNGASPIAAPTGSISDSLGSEARPGRGPVLFRGHGGTPAVAPPPRPRPSGLDRRRGRRLGSPPSTPPGWAGKDRGDRMDRSDLPWVLATWLSLLGVTLAMPVLLLLAMP
jgi:hypothetical protein